jgi:hypothetical protein
MKEYCVFNSDGTLAFTVNSLIGIDNYLNNSNYKIIENDKLDPSYSWTLVNGIIIKGEKWPVPEV